MRRKSRRGQDENCQLGEDRGVDGVSFYFDAGLHIDSDDPGLVLRKNVDDHHRSPDDNACLVSDKQRVHVAVAPESNQGAPSWKQHFGSADMVYQTFFPPT